MCASHKVGGNQCRLQDVAMQGGHEHVVAFLKNLSSISEAFCTSAIPIRCKPCSSDERECANCGVSKSDRLDLLLKACSRCKLVNYCSKPCQQQHWKTGEHKRFCVAVCDRKAINVETDGHVIKPLETMSTHAKSNNECAVCLEPLSKSITFALQCGHVFHHDCITGVQFHGLSQTCPLCRSGLTMAGNIA